MEFCLEKPKRSFYFLREGSHKADWPRMSCVVKDDLDLLFPNPPSQVLGLQVWTMVSGEWRVGMGR